MRTADTIQIYPSWFIMSISHITGMKTDPGREDSRSSQ